MSEWKEIELGQYVDILSSKRIFAADYVPEGIPFFRSKEVIERALGQDISNPLYITEKRFQDIKSIFGSPIDGDILISAVGERAGIPYLVQNEGDFYFKDGNLIWFRQFSEKLDSEYLVYFLKSRIGQFQLENLMIGSAQKALTIIGLKSLVISVPGINQQRGIAKTLSNLDQKITLLRQQNQDLEELAQTLFKRWFVEFEFPDSTGKPYKENGGKMVESELGEIPEGWFIKRLEEVSKLIAGGDKPKNATETKTEQNNVPIYSNGIKEDGLYGFTDKARIFEESITVSARGTIGYVSLKNEPFVPIVRLISATPIQDVLTAKYLFLWLKKQSISGSGTTQQQLTIPEFKDFEVLVPSNNVLVDFTSIIDSFYNKINLNKIEIQTLTQLRDTLLPKLMSGELRVKDM